MKVLSLFDGISCGQIALQRAGIPVEEYFASEIDKYSIQITMKNFPNTKQLGDVKNVFARNLPKIDLLIGGSPCQDLSITRSQTRKGLKGNKSILFWHYVRLLRTCKPKYFLLENVGSMKKEDKEEITKILGVQPMLINSSLVSAQNRERLYWTNIPVTILPKDKGLFLKDIMQNDVEEKYFYTCSYDNLGENSVCALLHINGNDILKRVHSPNYKCHTLTTCGGGNTQKKVMDNGRPRKLTPLEYERLQTLPDNYTNCVSNIHRYNACGNGWTVDIIAHIFSFIPKEEQHATRMDA